MNAILVSLLVLATLVTLCNTQCFIIPNQNSGSNECKDLDGITHPLDSQWKTENCEECSCSQNGINCCSLNLILSLYQVSTGLWSVIVSARLKPSEPFLPDMGVHLQSVASVTPGFDTPYPGHCYIITATIAVPVDYDTEKCKKVFNKETCSYKVVERDNPENPCAVSQWVL